MTNKYGPIVQIAYVARDVPATIRHFLSLGIGPWYYGDTAAFDSFDYLGSTEHPDFEYAIAYWGSLQIELMCQKGPVPSIVKRWMDKPFEKMLQHHVAIFPEDYEGTIARATADGYEVHQRVGTIVGGFTFLIHPDEPDFILEIVERTPARVDYGAYMEASQHDWTEETAIRAFGSRP